MKRLLFLLILGLMLVVGCSGQPHIEILNGGVGLLSGNNNPEAAGTVSLTPQNTATPLPSSTSTQTPTATYTPIPSATITPSITPSPTWEWKPKGNVTAPILLYHHIADSQEESRYYISPQVFQEQMQTLKRLGYTSIPVSLIVKAITEGANLPPRPVAISFDDGDLDVYQNAFPVMQELGYMGNFYLVGNSVGGESIVSESQVKEMIKAGWEIGSHSMTHTDLTQSNDLSSEIYQSKARLKDKFKVPVDIFAYPFGSVNPSIFGRVIEWGYKGAVGLGGSYENGPQTVYYLSRIEVMNGQGINEFLSMLPWKE